MVSEGLDDFSPRETTDDALGTSLAVIGLGLVGLASVGAGALIIHFVMRLFL